MVSESHDDSHVDLDEYPKERLARLRKELCLARLKLTGFLTGLVGTAASGVLVATTLVDFEDHSAHQIVIGELIGVLGLLACLLSICTFDMREQVKEVRASIENILSMDEKTLAAIRRASRDSWEP